MARWSAKSKDSKRLLESFLTRKFTRGTPVTDAVKQFPGYSDEAVKRHFNDYCKWVQTYMLTGKGTYICFCLLSLLYLTSNMLTAVCTLPKFLIKRKQRSHQFRKKSLKRTEPLIPSTLLATRQKNRPLLPSFAPPIAA